MQPHLEEVTRATVFIARLARFRRLESPMAVVRPRGNVPASPLRWTIERGSAEFKLAANTFRKILNQSGAKPDQGGCYTTQQICECLFGDLHSETVRKERQLVRKYEIENQISEASLLDRVEIAKGLAAIADAVVSKIMSSPLPRDVKEDVLRDIAEIPIKLVEVGDRQTKLRRTGGNGNGSED